MINTFRGRTAQPGRNLSNVHRVTNRLITTTPYRCTTPYVTQNQNRYIYLKFLHFETIFFSETVFDTILTTRCAEILHSAFCFYSKSQFEQHLCMHIGITVSEQNAIHANCCQLVILYTHYMRIITNIK